ncbi:uncharacterized protein [Parasteatoda tepidariorum]|uniref:uncharacterized protein n=1 Tax=Parasteatoda tepidariorum TaxID=114398 RepID=UPI00077FA12C|nr:S-antigen protein [Parasteatoda tepidariorum]
MISVTKSKARKTLSSIPIVLNHLNIRKEWGQNFLAEKGEMSNLNGSGILERRNEKQHKQLKRCVFFLAEKDPEDTYSPEWMSERNEKRLSEFLGGPGKRVSEFLGGPGKRMSEFLGGPGKRVSEFLGGPGKRVSEFLGGPGKRHAAGNAMHDVLQKRVSEFLGGPGKRSDYYDFLENSDRR